MEFLEAALKAIPQAVQSWPAFAAYSLAIIAWLIYALKVLSIQSLLREIHAETLDAGQKSRIILARIGEPVPPTMDAEQFLRYKRQKYLYSASVMLTSVVVVVVGVAFYYSYSKYTEARQLADQITITSGPSEYLTKGEVPVGATFNIQATNVAAGGEISWTKPQVGKLTTYEGPSMFYTATEKGPEAFKAIIKIDGFTFAKSIAFNVVELTDAISPIQAHIYSC